MAESGGVAAQAAKALVEAPLPQAGVDDVSPPTAQEGTRPATESPSPRGMPVHRRVFRDGFTMDVTPSAAVPVQPPFETVVTNEPLFDKVEVSTNTAVPVKSALTRGVARANKRMARSGFHRRSFSAPMLAGDDGCVADDEGSSDTETEAESDVEPVTPCDTDDPFKTPPQQGAAAVHWEATQMLGGATVTEVVRGIVRACVALAQAGRPSLKMLDPRRYCLRIMEDGEPDFDFPELDPSVAVESSGETDFALCVRGTETMTLHIRIRATKASTGLRVLKVMFRHPGSDPVAAASPARRPSVEDTAERRRSVSMDAGFTFDALLAAQLPDDDGARARAAHAAQAERAAAALVLGGGAGGGPGSTASAASPASTARSAARERANERLRQRGRGSTPTLCPDAVAAATKPRVRCRSHACRGEADLAAGGLLGSNHGVTSAPSPSGKAKPDLTLKPPSPVGLVGPPSPGGTTTREADTSSLCNGIALTTPSPRHRRHHRRSFSGGSGVSTGSTGIASAGADSVGGASHRSHGSGASLPFRVGDTAAGSSATAPVAATPGRPRRGTAPAAPPATPGSGARPPTVPPGMRHRMRHDAGSPKRRTSWWRRLLGRKSAAEEAEIRARRRSASNVSSMSVTSNASSASVSSAPVPVPGRS